MSGEGEGARLNEMDKVEWFDVVRQVQPDLTWEAYCEMWEANQRKKAERERRARLH